MVKTIDVSKEQIKELGNAIAAYADVLWGAYLGLPVTSKFECFKDMSKGELMARLDALKTLHKELDQ